MAECCTYMLRCCDGSLYTGWTTDLQKRLTRHNAGAGAKYTRSRRPVQLVYYEIFATREEAMRRECEIKRLTRAQKLALIACADFGPEEQTGGDRKRSGAVTG